MSSIESKTEEIAEKRIGLTLGIHVIPLLVASSIPEGDFLFWFPISLLIEILIIAQLLRMWKKYKYDAKKYYTIQIYWMLVGMSYFSMSPFVKIWYGTFAFWPVLVFTISLFIYAHVVREKIAEVFVNPKKGRQLNLWPVIFCIIVFVGIIIMAVLRAKSYHPNLGLVILIYMVGGMMLFIGTPFSVSAERFEKLKGE